MRSILFPILGASLFALAVAALIVYLAGENPMTLIEALKASLSPEGLGYTLFYATPFILTGLSVAVSFHCGLFNIGGEGQLYMGSLAVVFVSTRFSTLPLPLAVLSGVTAALVGGALWGALAGGLKALRGSHEVIVTILLNFIAYAIVDYSILYLFKDPQSQSPETALMPTQFQIPTFDQLLSPLGIQYFKSTPVNLTLLLAILAAAAVWVFLGKTRWGFELRTVGAGQRTARFAGMSVARSTLAALSLSGALSGLVGVNEVMGHEHRFIQGFSPGYGFTGIAVALLGRNHPAGVILSALLFGLLHNMSREIEFATSHVSKELALVLQAILVLAVALAPSIMNQIRRSQRV